MQTKLFEHFIFHVHNSLLEDCLVNLIDKTDGADPIRREEYWRRVMKMRTPCGLNTVSQKFYTLPGFYTSFIGQSGRNVKSLTPLLLLPVRKNLKMEARIIQKVVNKITLVSASYQFLLKGVFFTVSSDYSCYIYIYTYIYIYIYIYI